MIYSANFGPDYASAPVGVTEYSSAGVIVVARSTSSVVHIANGFYVRDFTPNVGTTVLQWDTAGSDPVYAYEVLQAVSSGSGASLAEIEASSVLAKEATVASRLASASYIAPDNATITSIAGYLDTEITAIKSKTDTIPSNPALATDIPSAATVASAVRTNLATELGRLDAATSTRMATFTYTAPPTAASNATAVRTELTTELGRVDASVSSRLATSSYAAAPLASANATAVRTELSTELGRLDAAISTRLATSGYTAPDNATIVSISQVVDTEIAAIKSKTDTIPVNPAQVGSAMTLTVAYDSAKTAASQASVTSLGTPLQAVAYTAPDNTTIAAISLLVDTEIAAIKAKTDTIPANPALVGSAMTLTSAYDPAKTAASQASVTALGSPLQGSAYIAPPTATEIATEILGTEL